MRPFVFKLQALLKFRRHRREMVERIMAQVQADERRLAEQRDDIHRSRAGQLDELRALVQQGAINVDRAAAIRYYATQLTIDSHLVERQRLVVAEQLALCRQALMKADQEVKVLEKLEEKRRNEFQHEQERKAARDLEEAWLAVRATEFAR